MEQDRQQIPDVPAVYFVEATKANIDRIAKDVCTHLYDSFYLSFDYRIPRPLLEDLAGQCTQGGAVDKIEKVLCLRQYKMTTFVCIVSR